MTDRPTKFQIMRQHREKMADCAARRIRDRVIQDQIRQMQNEIRDNLRRIQGGLHGKVFPSS